MGFPGPWGKNPFSCHIIGAALSCHRFTQRTKPPIIGKDNVLHATDSPKKHSPQSAQPPLIEPSSWKVIIDLPWDQTPARLYFFLGF
jgi:hypothetical protein